jgi:uncharacterized protein YeaO (DUF488 family)
MIRLKRAYAPATADDGQRFLVDRLWPRGVRADDLRLTAWLKEVGPSPALRRWFGHDRARWSAFAERYRQELADQPALLDPLLAAAHAGEVTLVFAARDEQHNQAVVLKQVLEERLADRT